MLKNLGSEVLTRSAAEVRFYQSNTSFNTSIEKTDIMALFQTIEILIQVILCAKYKTTSSESDHTLVLKSVSVRRQGIVFLSFSLGIKLCEILVLLQTMEGHGWTHLL